MSKPLLIVESPTKARTISQYTSGEYEVLACVGHIKDLPRKELGIDVDNQFAIKLEVLPDRKTFIRELKQKAKVAEKVVLATDPDREGEAIADHLASEIPKANIVRVQFTEITKAGVAQGMSEAHPIDEHLVAAQKARRIIDRLVGYKISPILWNTLQKTMSFVNSPLSAGRVQSAAVKILVDRERKRATFTASEYYDLEAELATPEGETFKARLIRLNDSRLARGNDFDRETGVLSNSKVLVLSKSQAEALAEELQPGPWNIADIQEKPQVSRPRPPFTTSTLQQEAARKLRLGARQTMRLAQQLYEAGFITYMRTDSTHLSQEALSRSRSIIASQFGQDYLPKSPVQYVTKVKNAQEAHEAIRPSGTQWTAPAVVSKSLGTQAAKLYDLIWKRTLASQMTPARIKQTILLITCQNSRFEARGKVIVFPGYMRVYVEGRDDPGKAIADRELVLPSVAREDNLTCGVLTVLDHITKPPARFTEASLIKELETRGIGRPSTYASIIDTIQKREYVKNIKGTLTPTFLAVAVTQLLENHFALLVDAGFTARMENNLDAISRGEADMVPVLNSFYFGDETFPGLEPMLQTKVDIRKACTISLGTFEDMPIEVRIGNYGPYITWNEERKSVPDHIPMGDLNLKKALDILATGTEEDETLGQDPKSGEMVYLKHGPYGLYVQQGDTKKRKAIPKGTAREDVTLEYALQLLALPREVGQHPESGEPILADYGRYGPYLKHKTQNAKLTPPLSPLTITLDEALAVFSRQSRPAQELKSIGEHPETKQLIVLKEGRYGPYVTDGKVNASLPKDLDMNSITLELAVELIDKRRAAGPKKRRRRKK
ncbi:MAG: type I DNA topoisomerase [Fidelibacterota bacterium]